MSELLDPEAVFGDDYLHFFPQHLDEERSDGEAELAWRLLGLRPGLEVLDLACGSGRIAVRLAERGCRVTGLDRSEPLLELAREQAARRGVRVELHRGDMRSLPWRRRFDRVLCWSASFGYFDDQGNQQVLAGIREALVPGGRLLVDVLHRDRLVGAINPVACSERGGDLLVDRHRFDPLTGRVCTERVVVRGGQVRRSRFAVRLLGFTELRDWLHRAGFRQVEAYGEDGAPLAAAHQRILAVAVAGAARGQA